MNGSRLGLLGNVLALAALAFGSLTACADGEQLEEGEQAVCSGTIAGDHGHAMHIVVADVAAGENKTYDITGSADHAHSVTLTAGHFAELADLAAVTVASSAEAGHSHDVTVACH